MKVDVSNGEIIDKITILTIKKEKIQDINKLKNIDNELNILLSSLSEELNNLDKKYYNDLYDINLKLWEVEDKLREKEAKKDFDYEFIELARKVYINNDQRAKIKYNINILTSSNLIEEKQHTQYE
jgi:hypothetical protein